MSDISDNADRMREALQDASVGATAIAGSFEKSISMVDDLVKVRDAPGMEQIARVMKSMRPGVEKVRKELAIATSVAARLMAKIDQL